MVSIFVPVCFLEVDPSTLRPPGSRFVRTGSLHVTDDRTGLVVHELDANLGDTTTRA